MDQVLWIETLVKGAAGFFLFLAPNSLIRAFALPGPATSFWPRLLATLLLALALVTFLTGAKIIDDGIGLGALAILNFSAATFLAAHGMATRASQRRRSRALIAVLTLLLFGLAGIELIIR